MRTTHSPCLNSALICDVPSGYVVVGSQSALWKGSQVGTFRYGLGVVKLRADDTTLAHLQAVMSAKLRRGESFMLSWDIPTDKGSGRATVWIDQSVQMHFKYDDDRASRMDRSMLEELSLEAMHAAGINLSESTHSHEATIL